MLIGIKIITPLLSLKMLSKLFLLLLVMYTRSLDATSLTSNALEYAQTHFKILSGLYGILKPLDLIQAYRLEMGTKISINNSTSLYDFWSNHITSELNANLESTNLNFY